MSLLRIASGSRLQMRARDSLFHARVSELFIGQTGPPYLVDCVPRAVAIVSSDKVFGLWAPRERLWTRLWGEERKWVSGKIRMENRRLPALDAASECIPHAVESTRVLSLPSPPPPLSLSASSYSGKVIQEVMCIGKTRARDADVTGNPRPGERLFDTCRSDLIKTTAGSRGSATLSASRHTSTSTVYENLLVRGSRKLKAKFRRARSATMLLIKILGVSDRKEN